VKRDSYVVLAARMVAERRARTFGEACALLGRRGGTVSAKAKAARKREIERQTAQGLR